MTFVPSSVFKWICLLGLDLGPVGKDLEDPGLEPGVGVGPSWVLPAETSSSGGTCYQFWQAGVLAPYCVYRFF